MYLNTGLTSTKNYGKTILTKVRSYSQHQLLSSTVLASFFPATATGESLTASSVFQQEADLVTTHELGHNFGAEHDPDDMPDCAPREDQGGKYVMYPIAVSGDHTNNKVVSCGNKGCSVQLVKSV